MSNIVCFGEVLWDVFPTHKKIGGAPLNVALRIKSFNHNVLVVSAVGDDESGVDILAYLKRKDLEVSGIQQIASHPTGFVKVILNKKGSASYDIKYPSAWDKIQITERAKAAVLKSDAFVFGSLITRDDISKSTLFQLIKLANYKVFDVNLRPPHYSKDELIKLMEVSNFIKFNDQELFEISAYLGSNYKGLEQNLYYVSQKTNTKHICVTKGEHGAVLLYEDLLFYNSGYQVEVVDTVGSGDSFLGSLISELQLGRSPQKAIDFACAIGAMVAQSQGANPSITTSEVEEFINPKG